MATVVNIGVQTFVTLDFGKWFYQEKQIQYMPEVDGIYVAHAGTIQTINGVESFHLIELYT